MGYCANLAGREYAAPNEKYMATDVVIVIPAYNEAATIADVIERCLRTGRAVIVVDDGSTDDTAAIAGNYPVEILRNERNAGKAASLMKGMRRAMEHGAEIIATMDGDGQHRPEDLESLLEYAGRHPRAIIIGSRLHDRMAFPRERYIGNRIADFWISWACGYRVDDSQSGFRLYPGDLLSRIDLPHGPERGFVFESEILIEAARVGVRSYSAPIPALYEGTLVRASHFQPLRDVLRIIRMVAWKLISRGMYPQGLWRVLTGRDRSG
jgi:glycosyltransferase involved in cell wall biosynthesis